MESVELLVIGGGAAGMAAALAAEEAGAEGVLLCERAARLGGVLPQCLHHGFGLSRFGEDLTGAQYAERFTQRLRGSAVETALGAAVVELREDKTALITAPTGLRRVAFDRCLLATGCRERPLGALGPGGTRPAGIFTAGAAQKLVNLGNYTIGREIVILGSGDVGQIMARELTRRGCRIVAVVEQRGELGGLARNRHDCIEAPGIPVLLRATVESVAGVSRVRGVTLRHLDTGLREFVPCDTLVTALGLIPERELLRPLEREGALPGWVTPCGNCDYVHDIVDSVTRQAERLGALRKGEREQ